MSQELELIAEGMRAVATNGSNGAPGARDDGQLWGAFPNTMTVHDLAEHVVSVLSAHGYSIVQLPKPYPDETVHPYWVAEDGNGPQVVRVTDSEEGVEGNWVDIEFSARHRTITRETARELGLALLAAAAAAEEDK